jgi:endonuclease/exonuclease/phosphatase family metal-dependent hydrolase
MWLLEGEMRRMAFALAAMFLLGAPSLQPATVAADGVDAASVSLREGAPMRGVPLTVMTYNVHGLPWPVVADRSAALNAIGDRLAAMHRRGIGPQIVVLQEAFSSDARRIVARAGYPYVADGPAAAEASPPFPEAPLSEHYWMRGEGWGAHLSSGLVLMSDYPILDSWRAAFPRTACAGYDCLANKGVMLARIAVPGLPVPVEIATAHMNSLGATRTPRSHADAAYLRELAAVDRFVAAHSDRSLPLIFAADLNLDSDHARIAGLEASRADWNAVRGDHGGGGVFAICGKPDAACRPGVGFAAIEPGKRNNDWQFFAGGRDVAIQAESIALHFQPDDAGRTLSDHQALMVGYRMSAMAG